MYSAYQFPVQSDPTTQFTQAIPQNGASENTDLVLPQKDPLWFIVAIELLAMQNLDFELWLFSRASNLGGTFGSENFLSSWQFVAQAAGPPATPGSLVTPVGGVQDPIYRWYIDGNMMPYRDLDAIAPASDPTANANAQIHCRLINRNAVAKSADAAGAVQVIFWVSQQRNW